MIFTLVSIASEWMQTKVEERKEEIRQEKERKLKEFEAIEQKKFEGKFFLPASALYRRFEDIFLFKAH